MPKAVSDSSTLIHLAGIGHLNLLVEFYEKILIPPAVWKEVVEEGQGRPGTREVEEGRRSRWIEVVKPSNKSVVRLLKLELHDGEAEAIALAIEQHPEIVFLDETEARRVADAYGLHKTGLIGILLRAKLEGKVQSLRGELDRLRQEAGFWIGDDVYQQALQAVGEE